MTKKYNILICPLGWGLGHAGRMIPVAEILQKAGHNIYIGAGREIRDFFTGELSGLTCIELPGFSPRYSAVLPQYLALTFQLPVLIYHIMAEHFRLKRIIRSYNIDIVISDNRFGLWNRNIRTVYITHQLVIPFPAGLRSLEWAGVCFHRFFIRKYNYCFVPDLPGEPNLSGRLSHPPEVPANVRYIGLLSRFRRKVPGRGETDRQSPDYLVILSGPEPQRSILRKKIVSALSETDSLTAILEGRPSGAGGCEKKNNLISYCHLPRDEMENLLIEAGNIITRAGYSTIMELISLSRSALLIPAPGQTEQEYLADYLSGKGWFTTVNQNGFSVPVARFSGKPPPVTEILSESRELLEKALSELLQ